MKQFLLLLLLLNTSLLEANVLKLIHFDKQKVNQISHKVVSINSNIKYSVNLDTTYINFGNFEHEIYPNCTSNDNSFFLEVDKDTTTINLLKLLTFQQQYLSPTNKLLYEMYLLTSSFPFKYRIKTMQDFIKLNKNKQIVIDINKSKIDESYNTYLKKLKEISHKYDTITVAKVVENNMVTYFDEICYYDRLFTNHSYQVPNKNDELYKFYEILDSIASNPITTKYYNYSIIHLFEKISNYNLVKKNNIKDIRKANIKVTELVEQRCLIMKNLSIEDKKIIIASSLISLHQIPIIKKEVAQIFQKNYATLVKDKSLNELVHYYNSNKFLYDEVKNLTIIGKQNQPIKLDQLIFNNSKEVILLFWASWCVRCKEQIEKFKQLKKDNPTTLYVNVSIDKNIENWKKGKVKYGFENDCYLDSNYNNSLVNFLQLSTVPSVYKLSKKDGLQYLMSL